MESFESRGKMLNPLDLYPDTYAPVTEYSNEELDQLSESIREHGLVEPLHVKNRAGRYEVIVGEKRWRAAKKAGIDKVPVIEHFVTTSLIRPGSSYPADYRFTVGADWSKRSEMEKTAEIESLFKTAKDHDYHVVEVPWAVLKNENNEFCYVIDKNDGLDLDILFVPDDQDTIVTKSEMDSLQFYVDITNRYDFGFSFGKHFPNGLGGENGWKTFSDYLWPMQIKVESVSTIRLWGPGLQWRDDHSALVTPINGATAGVLYEDLKKLDQGSWEIGLDYADLEEALFKGAGFELYYLRWDNEPDVSEHIENDINTLLQDKGKTAASMMLWAAGDTSLLDVNDAYGNIIGSFGNINYLWQAAYIEKVATTFHAIIVCKKEKAIMWKKRHLPGAAGPEGGIIYDDEEYNGCRITLEKCPNYYAITCGVYGLMVHTVFRGIEDYQETYDNMKKELAEFIDRETTEDESLEFCEYFTRKYC